MQTGLQHLHAHADAAQARARTHWQRISRGGLTEAAAVIFHDQREVRLSLPQPDGEPCGPLGVLHGVVHQFLANTV